MSEEITPFDEILAAQTALADAIEVLVAAQNMLADATVALGEQTGQLATV